MIYIKDALTFIFHNYCAFANFCQEFAEKSFTCGTYFDKVRAFNANTNIYHL